MSSAKVCVSLTDTHELVKTYIANTIYGMVTDEMITDIISYHVECIIYSELFESMAVNPVTELFHSINQSGYSIPDEKFYEFKYTLNSVLRELIEKECLKTGHVFNNDTCYDLEWLDYGTFIIQQMD